MFFEFFRLPLVRAPSPPALIYYLCSPSQIGSPLRQNNPRRHALAKTEPSWLGFWDFCPKTPSRLHRSIAATHPLNLTLSHLNHIPPMQKQPLPPCVSENRAHTARFPGFLPSHPRRSIAATHPLNPTLSHLNNIPPMQKQPPPLFVSQNRVHAALFSGFLSPRPSPARAAR
jgi:hypothetical protein